MPLFDTTTLLAYLAAAAVLVLIPGPGTAWIVAQTAAGGTRQGLRAGLGLETATLIHAVAAGLGLSAVLATSAFAFELLKYAGAAYLVWLGIRAWYEKPTTVASTTPPSTTMARHVYRRSVLTGVLNPKVALFFLAFLPQFVAVDSAHKPLAFLLLGGIFIFNSTLWCLGIAAFAARAASRIRRSEGVMVWINRVLGGMFVYLGFRVAMMESR